MYGIRKRENQESPRGRDGFSLIEIMVVVIILAILAATIVPQFGGLTQEARVNSAKSHIATLDSAIERFYLSMDRYPTSSEGLKVLVEEPADAKGRWRGPFVKEVPDDPWGNPYQYRAPGQHGVKTYDLWSFGSDGAEGGEEGAADVTNWKQEKK